MMNRLMTIYLSFMFILAMNMTSVLSVKAENYPYRSDYLWLTVPDHADWLYKTGEQAKVEVSFYKYGIPRDGEVKYEIGDDMLKADKKGSFKLKNGRAIVNIGTRKTPGFRDLRLFYQLDGKTYQHHIKVGFSVDKIQPYTQEPKDFDSFWQKAKDELKNVPMSYTKELAKEYCTDKIDCYLVKLQIDKMGHAMYGYLFYPKNGEWAVTDTEPTKDNLKTLHKLIKKVSEDIEVFSYNTSIPAFMIAVGELAQQKCTSRAVLEQVVALLAPFAPHIAEELWHSLGHTTTVCDAEWPKYDEQYLKEDTQTLSISFNGKTRFTLDFPADATKEAIQEAALTSEQAQKHLEGKQVVKVIVVPGRIVNIVVK